MLPPEVTDVAIESELPAAIAWAERHEIAMDISLLSERTIRFVFVQTYTDEEFYLQGRFNDYRALPPVWEWRDKSWSISNELNLSPNPIDNPFGSMFINHNQKGIICAPFNRLAYGVHDGPHNDWGNAAQWITAGQGYVYAVVIGDMLQLILRDFRFTNGRMA